jgi:hypothetical protein
MSLRVGDYDNQTSQPEWGSVTGVTHKPEGVHGVSLLLMLLH